jgi:diguanylate cyclase (GGDEF)-like protein
VTSLSRIADVAVRLASSLEPGEVCATAVRAVGEALSAAACSLYDFSPTHELVTLQAAWSADGDPDAGQLVGVPFPLADRPGLREAIRERRTVETHVNDPGLTQAERDEMWADLTILATPLVFRGEVIGALTRADKSLRRATQEERDLFEQLAAIAALALGNARLFAGQQDHNRHLAALLEASRAVSSTVVLDEVLAVLARKAVDALPIVRCRVYEYDSASGLLAERTGYAAPFDDGELPAVPDADDPSSVVRRALSSSRIETERLTLPAQVRRRPRLRTAPDRYLTRFAVPIVFGGVPLGAMAFLESRGERELSVTELELAQALAAQAGAAIRNAHLFDSLKEQAVTDGLTGLHNHRYFYDRLGDEIARARRYGAPLSLLMLDVDGFKEFNDAHGHRAGDDALRTIAHLLQAQLRKGIDVLARYGGEEFAVILLNTAVEGAARKVTAPDQTGATNAHVGTATSDMGTQAAVQAAAAPAVPTAGTGRPQQGDGALCVAERLRRSVEAAGTGGLRPARRLTVSVGVAQLTDGLDTAAFVATADAALYQAKERGKNQVCSATS